MLEFNGKKPILKNLTIDPIPLSNEQHQQLDKIISSKKASVYKDWKVRSIMINRTGTQWDIVVVVGSYRPMF